MSLKSFSESSFVVAWSGESPASSIIHGWEAVLDHIDEEADLKHEGWSVRNEDCELHEMDEWERLRDGSEDDRFLYRNSEFLYCVGITIVRITEVEEGEQPTTNSRT